MKSSADLPALLGGEPVRPDGPPQWPIADSDVLAALQQAYQDGSWGKYHGGNVERLEDRLRSYFQVEYALPCGSGTFAVEVALRGLKIEAGNEVILAGYDYPGNFHSVHAVGALPVLVDVAPHNWNLLPEKVEQAVSPKTRAVIASHLHGGLVPMRELMTIAGQHNLAVIEDAAQCPGALVAGKKAGTWGDAGILSFGGSKLLSAGRGGAVLTNHADVCQRIRRTLMRGNHICPLSELQAAVLLPQLEKLDDRNARRAANVQLLQQLLADVPGLQPFANEIEDSFAAYYKVGFRFDAPAFGLPRETFVAALRAEGIALDEGFRALHAGRSPRRYRQGSDLTEADKAHGGCVILHHPVLLGGEEEMSKIARAVRRIWAFREDFADCHAFLGGRIR